MAYIQSRNQRVASGANALAFTSANGAGNLLTALVMIEDDTSTVSSVTDTAGNTWTAIGTIKHSAASGMSLQWWYAKNSIAGANTVTVTPSAGASTICLHEHSGEHTTVPLDTSVSNTSGTGTTADSTALTTTASGDLLLSGCVSNRALTVEAGSTQRESTSFNFFVVTQEKISGAAGSYNATMTLASSGASVIYLAAFKAAPVGAFVPGRLSLLRVGA